MKRAAKFIALAAAGLIGFLILAAAIFVVGANTGPGRRAVEALAADVSHGELVIQGLAGRFPDRLRAAEVTLRDSEGVYARFDKVTFDWSPVALFAGELKIDTLAAAGGTLERLPVESGGGMALPPLRIAHLDVGRLELAAPVAGVRAAVRVQGHLGLTSLTQGSAAFDVTRLDAPGSYRADVTLTPEAVTAALEAKEPGHGLIAGLAGLPDLGPLAIKAHLAGPRDAVRTDINVAAGPLRADAAGTVDLATRRVELGVTGTAPAMAPRPGLSWHSAKLDAHVAGPVARPEVSAHLTLDRLIAAGGSVQKIAAEIAGTEGTLRLKAELSGLRVPGPKPDLFAAAPVTVTAEAKLQAPARPVVFSLDAPSVSVQGQADTKGKLKGKIALRLASLAPVTALTSLGLKGEAAVDASFAAEDGGYRIAAQGKTHVTGGVKQVVSLLGPEATFDIDARVQGSAIVIDRATLAGKALHASLQGKREAGKLDFAYRLVLSDLAALAPNLTGALDTKGKIAGPETDFALTAQSHGTLGAKGIAPGIAEGPVEIALDAQGLPDAPSARIKATGTLAGAPLDLAAKAVRTAKGGLQVAIDRAQWKSASVQGNLALPAAGFAPAGKVRVRVARLRDLAPFLGTTLGGSVDATLEASAARGRTELGVQGVAQGIAFAGKTIGRATLDGRIADPLTRPVLALKLGLDDIAAGDVTGRAQVRADGPLHALALHLDANAATKRGPAKLAAAATLDLGQRRLALASLDAALGGARARLLAPARLDFRDGVTLQSLRLGVDKGVVTADGRLSPRLNFRLSARDLDPDLARLFLPGINAGGSFAIDAQLAGAWTSPEGTVRITGHALRVRQATSGGLPPADFNATAKLAKGRADLDAALTAGTTTSLRLSGDVPLQAGGKLDLRSTGSVDLALFNAFLAANGRTLEGRVTLDSQIGGTLAQPVATGRAELSRGAFRDYVRGIRITDMSGLVRMEGDTLRLERLNGKAGPGTVSVEGTLKLTPGLPLSLAITMKNAEPITTDLLTARMDADIKVQGAAASRLDVAGSIHIDRATINIPNTYPQSVAVLDVRAAGKAPPPRPRAVVIGLNLTIDAPARIFVQGHGLSAEMGGRLTIGGTDANPDITGGFQLLHGDLAIVSQTLTLTKGTITFLGQSFAGRLDPTLDFTAQTTTNGVTATLALTGYADHPQIALTSSPNLPQSEILSLLLFGQETARLSAFQAAQLAQALASLSGVGGGLDPLAMVRNSLGLDRLSVGAGATPTSMPTVEAGKYITPNVYVGAKQGKLGSTQAEVQINLTKNLKVTTTVAAGSGALATGAAAGQDTGSTVGLTYQFEY